ncbi:MAG TPA: hypothetical protein VIG48_06685 [Jatrophihabitans sp.]
MAGPRRRARPQGAGSAFRPSAPNPAAGHAPSRTQTIALLCGLVLVAAGIAAVSYLVKPATARSFNLFYGSVYLDDNTSPVAVDLASGKPTVRLANAFTAVSAKAPEDINAYPLDGGNTLLLDPATGEFNMVDSTGFVIKSSDGGVPLPKADGPTTSTAVPAGSSAYIVRRSSDATSVYLVGAATVSASFGSRSGTKARAYATLPAPVSTDPVPVADAGGALWMLTRDGGQTRRITELTVPPGSNAGVTLTATARGTVTGPAAVASATSDPLGTGSSGDAAVGVASADSVAVFRGSDRTRVPVSAGPGVDTILPATNAHGALVFLYHSSTGWSLVSVPATAGTLAQVHPLRAIPADARLARPAASDGSTYTMDTARGSLWQIGASGAAEQVPGAASYPLKRGEKAQFDATEVLADGGRVIFNSRANLQAEVVFSDGSHAPRTIDKHAAVQVDPSGATALADAHTKGQKAQKGKTHKPVKAPKQPTQTINDKIDCKVAKQVPRVPTLVAGDRAARSISLNWIYQKLDPSDCYPSTYVVDIKVLSSNAPSPPSGQVTVQGQDGVTLTHLFPATEYELTVTAFINTEHTTSAPIRVTTGPEGPAAPTGVRASADSSGNWTVSWNSCGGIAQGCVPSATWYLIPSFCDGRGLSGAPAKVTVPGDPTQHSFSHVYTGGTALLGRAMCFQVQGVSPQGTIGTTSATSAPAFSWTTPLAGALQLHASQPANTTFGGTTTTTVDLDLGADPTRDVGGIGASITLKLTGPGGAQTKSVVWDGRTDRVSEQFAGIKAGAQYTATATIAPPRHPADAVSVGPATVTTRASWPALSAQASCPAGNGPVTLSCTLVVRMSGPSSAQAGGERFDLTNSSLTCGGGNSAKPLTKYGFDPANEAITASVDLLTYNGSCTVTVQLKESAHGSAPLVFGGTSSPVVTEPVDLGHATTLDAGQGDFSAQWDSHDGSSALVRYTGNHSDSDLAQITQGWQESLAAPNGTPCGSGSQQPTHGGIYVDVNPAGCVNLYGNQGGWQVTISYYDKGTANQHSFTYTLDGTPPGYIPCQVSGSNFAAAWDQNSDPNNPTVTVDYTKNNGDKLDGCSNWNYTIVKNAVQGCGSAEPNGGSPDHGNGQTTVQSNCDTQALGLNFSLRIDFTRPDGSGDSYTINVSGSPPQPTPTPTPTTPTPTPTTPSPTPT